MNVIRRLSLPLILSTTFLLFAGGAVLFEAIAHAGDPVSPSAPVPLPKLLERSSSLPDTTLFSNPIGTDECQYRRLTFEGVDPWNEQARFKAIWEIYGSDSARGRAVLFVPEEPGSGFVDRRLAAKACERGVSSAILFSFTGQEDHDPDWKRHDRDLLRALTAIRWMMATFEGKSQVQFAIAGAGVGAVYAAVAASADRRIDRTVLMFGGAPFSEVVATSRSKEFEAFRKERYLSDKISSVAEYRARLESEIELDPGKYVGPREGRADMVFISLMDDLVPTQTQRGLVGRLAPMKIVQFNNSHFWAKMRAEILHADAILDHLVLPAPLP